MTVGANVGDKAADGVELVDPSFQDLPRFLLRMNIDKLSFIALTNRRRFSSLSTICAMTMNSSCDVINDC